MGQRKDDLRDEQSEMKKQMMEGIISLMQSTATDLADIQEQIDGEDYEDRMTEDKGYSESRAGFMEELKELVEIDLEYYLEE